MASDKAIVGLARDVGELKRNAQTTDDRLAHHSELLEQLAKGQEELLTTVKQLQVATSSLASSVGLAMTELATARSLERRVEKLEAAVFPPKH
jgi:hypothetical protein